MLEVRGGADLGEKPVAAKDGAELGIEHLEGDMTVVPEVAREVDGRHPAASDLALDVVAPAEFPSEYRGELWHTD